MFIFWELFSIVDVVTIQKFLEKFDQRENGMKNKYKLIILLCGFLVISACTSTEIKTSTPTLPATSAPTQATKSETETQPTEQAQPVDYLNLTYKVNDIDVTLVDGRSEVEAAPGSSTKILTQYFGNEAAGDLNGDGKQDVIFLLTQSEGGSGTFFYVVAALSTENGYVGSNAIVLGDRIAPQSTSIEGQLVNVTYVDRKPGEPFSAEPTVGMSKVLQVKDNQLVEVTQP